MNSYAVRVIIDGLGEFSEFGEYLRASWGFRVLWIEWPDRHLCHVNARIRGWLACLRLEGNLVASSFGVASKTVKN